MIVNPTPTGWEVIFQRAHGLLAGQLAYHWHKQDRPTRWMETLAAITQHDDGERVWSRPGLLTEGGAPKDFTLSTRLNLEPYYELTGNAQLQGRWNGLLISMHTSTLLEGYRGESKALDALLDEQKEHQKAWRKALGVTQQDAEKAYALLYWCDRLSLILCRRELPDSERALEIAKGPDGERYDVMQRGDGTVTVTPWAFDQNRFHVSVEVVCIEQATFKDDDALRAALKSAPVEVRTWEFVK